MLPDLTPTEVEQYKRQIMLPGFGEEAQRKLKAASATVTRVGGLGGSAALYLAVAGIGKLTIAHGGKITPSNLNRQILMRGDAVGEPRITHAAESLRRIRPDLEVVAIADNATPENVDELVAAGDVVCATTPDFAERLLLNEAAVKQRKPLVDSGMNDWDCQLTVVVPGQTPCVQCRVPEVPEWWDPYGFGVLGAVSGTLGCLTALEVIKVICGIGEPLAGTLLAFDLEVCRFDRYHPRRRPDCPVCGAL